MALALEGVRILELCRVAPGAYCTMILGDLGAEVIKVETPYEAGLALGGFTVSPSREDEKEREKAAYHPYNRNKKSIGLDLKLPQAKQIFGKLAQTADVILEGFRPGVVGRLGIDYDAVAKANPGIIYCSLSGYGQDGPYRDLPGHDINYISIGGALGLIGERGGEPILPLNLVGDYAGGSLQATIGILAALVARQKTGIGQYIDMAMTDGVVSLIALVAYDYFSQGLVTKRGQGLLGGAYPWCRAYKTRDDRYISLGCVEPHFWKNLCNALDKEDFIPFQWARGEKRKEIFNCFEDVFVTKTRDEWFEQLKGDNFPITKVYDIDEVFSDPQVVHREMVVEVDVPNQGKVKQVGIAIKLSGTPGEIRSTAPFLGQHTDELLLATGYGEKQIQEFRQMGAIV